MEYIRNCPKCGKELKTENKYYFNKSMLANSPCLSCSQKGKVFSEEHRENLKKNHADISGEKNPFYKKKHSDETKNKISKKRKEQMSSDEIRKSISDRQKFYHLTHDNSFKGKTHSTETKNKMKEIANKRFENIEERNKLANKTREWHKYNTNPFKNKKHTDDAKKLISIKMKNHYKKFSHNWVGRKHSNDSKKKMRISAIERIKKYGLSFKPTYNRKSISIIENYGKNNGYNFIHAENGGEYNVPNTSFYVDGYDSINNIVVEFDEKRHRVGKNKYTDKWRQDIIGEILKCKFVRIYEEDNSIVEFDYTTQR